MSKPKVKEIDTEARLSASLKQVQRQAAAAAPSMVPEKLAPPPEKEEERIPDIKELIRDTKTRLKLARLVQQEAEYAEEEKVARKAREPLTAAIKQILGEAEVGKAQVADFVVNYYNSPRESLDKILLMQNGVSPDVIARSTKRTDCYTLRINRIEDKAE